MNKCLLPDKVEEFKKAFKDKDIKMSDFLNLDHDDLVKKLEPYTGKNAEDVATFMEEKNILKNRMLGMKNAINKLTNTGKYSPEKIAESQKALSDYRAKQQERIFSPKEHESYLGGLVKKITGEAFPKEESKKIFDLTQAVSKAKEEEPTSSGISNKYFKAKDALDNYVDSQKPADVREAIAKNVAIIGRNDLILGLSTPVKTTVGQTTNSALDMLTRRIGVGEFNGANPELKDEIYKDAQNTMKETNRNTLGMEGIDDVHQLGFGKKAEDFSLPKEGKAGS